MCRNLENESCLSVKYSMKVVKICLARPLRESQKIFLDVKLKIRDRGIIGLDQENKIDIHYVWF